MEQPSEESQTAETLRGNLAGSADSELVPGTWGPWLERDARINELTRRLNSEGSIAAGDEIGLRLERASLLTRTGRTLEARADYLRIVELEPQHLENLTCLGMLLVADGRFKAAQMVFAEAVKHHPEDIVCRVNLGSVLLEQDENQAARVHYEAALAIDPEFPQAHGGMYYALTRLGEFEAAEVHQRKSFGRQNLFTKPYRGNSRPVTVLLLVSSAGGITPIEQLLDERVFETHVVVADFYEPGGSGESGGADLSRPLPAHDLLFNGIGDAEVADGALLAAEVLVGLTSTPVLNRPCLVRETTRMRNAERLRGVTGMVAPAIAKFAMSVLAGADGPAVLRKAGFRFPLLLRALGYHMGRHFIRVETAEQLADAIGQMPFPERPGQEVLAIEFLDARGADGCARKYRVMMVDGELYPLHLAISPDWKIHYFSADMSDRPDHRAEEARFLAGMGAVLGETAMDALKEIQSTLGLEYAGIDFGVNARGEVLLFEANATMIVKHPDEGEIWDYRHGAVDRIHGAVRRMLLGAAKV